MSGLKRGADRGVRWKIWEEWKGMSESMGAGRCKVATVRRGASFKTKVRGEFYKKVICP